MRIEKAELEAPGVEPLRSLGDESFRHQPLAHRIGQSVEAGRPNAAREIGAGLQRQHGGVQHVRSFLVALVYVHNRAAVGNDKAFEAPGVAQVILEQHLVGAGGPLVDGVVGAHDRLHMAFGHGGAEGWQIGLFEIAVAGIDVEAVAQLLRTAMHGEVLAGGDGAQVFEVVALDAGDKGNAQSAGEERVLAVGLLASAPAGIAEDVDVGRPEGQSIKDAVVAFTLGLVIFGPRLRGDDIAHAVDDRGVPGGAHADGLRKHGGIACAGDTVQRLVPRLVVGNAEPGNRGGPVFKLCGLLIQGHAPDQIVSAFGRGELGVEIGRLLGQRERGGGNDESEWHPVKPAAKRHEAILLGQGLSRNGRCRVSGKCRPA